MSNLKKVNREQLQNQGSRIDEVTSETINIMMSQSVSTEGRKVEIVTFPGGGQAIIVDDVLYQAEIMLYNYSEESDTDTNVTIGEVGLQIVSLEGAQIEEE